MPDPVDVDADAVVRRAPFSDNPRVGARGQRTRQRILHAALACFGDVGYHPCSIDSIAKRAGCSRDSSQGMTSIEITETGASFG